MKVILKDDFRTKLENLVEYIAQDRPIVARNLKNLILANLKDVSKRPQSCRKSIYDEDESIRDLILKGYTVVFRISSTAIEVFGLINREEKL
jgi:plasmid stabilization system protein ParE